jgi:hypothetical protein
MYVYCVYPAMSKKSENLSDLTKKDRNKRHSSPFINVVKGVFFVVRVTLVPVSYLSAPPAVHSYRVPGKFIRLVRIKQKFIRIAYLYSKCTDCRINVYIRTWWCLYLYQLMFIFQKRFVCTILDIYVFIIFWPLVLSIYPSSIYGFWWPPIL